MAVFWGMPYAASPEGERRWQAPVLAPGWTAVRDARRPAPVAFQRGAHPEQVMRELVAGLGLAAWQRRPMMAGLSLAFSDRLGPNQSENCLTVNVTAPSMASECR